MTSPILKVEGLNVYQGSYLAVRDVSFELLPGTDTAIVGPNGAGKSTLVKAILNLIPHSAGKIEIFGRPITKLGNLRHRLGYMPQNFIFDRSFPISVGELVGLGWANESRRQNSFFTKLWKKDRRKSIAIAEALRRTDAAHLKHQAIGTLSGGQLKRVLLAYCLVVPRKLLVLDEAFAGVDVQGITDFYALLNELKREEGWTVLQVSHDIDMVSLHCDRVLCLNQTVVCTGQPEIALSPQNLLATYGPGFSPYQHQH
ncbi:metal ABC transporter ATP-binding protein [Nodularia spumigena]|uniref:metal ABC transporter ATP-binding protein n=1 Tax=Nodularia spumigena TaxID=70799 RepID=UPI002330C04B|nr:metal ABC transporter ATP-binding protein [Nodularia spumigena]MDB9318708.1 metal ABC transporter ATP-binding protein [Nodularia spumigena CS-590/01A]MDB9323113.1 metal ABC transporter ATP-binding protein [Nodularia spumigena CS-591/07A]MDB9324698.1 metal ABC transporter ATP-binding protein [Nodularia spumigena CS-590/02]MDB9330952.1 metal ABC transporter ATP-binding protein [Nodularia spumigena CS-591/04]MDB9337008.1 metal ABC transporter ATP-binding protein [Nodularia spumigena CS-590/01]